jgi:hypothetical protein
MSADNRSLKTGAGKALHSAEIATGASREQKPAKKGGCYDLLHCAAWTTFTLPHAVVGEMRSHRCSD